MNIDRTQIIDLLNPRATTKRPTRPRLSCPTPSTPTSTRVCSTSSASTSPIWPGSFRVAWATRSEASAFEPEHAVNTIHYATEGICDDEPI